MVTDGVLDALPEERAEETLKEIILQTHAKAPQELGRGILQKVLALCEYKAADDMTVLAAGVWKNKDWKTDEMKKVFSYIEQYQMIKPDDRVIVGLSGGADSVGLRFY